MTLPNLVREYIELKEESKLFEKYIWNHVVELPDNIKKIWLDILKNDYSALKFVGNNLLTLNSKTNDFNVIPTYNILLATLGYRFTSRINELRAFLLSYSDNKDDVKKELDYAKKNKKLSSDFENWIDQNTESADEAEYVKKALTDYDSWGGGKTLDRNDSAISPLYNALSVSQSQSNIHEIIRLFGIHSELYDSVKDFIDKLDITDSKEFEKDPLEAGEDNVDYISGGENIIYYGAPGTGKSYGIKNYIREHGIKDYDPQTGNEFVFRVTLHPEYDYSDFVGQLLPNVKQDGTVTYEFTSGVFTSALKKAVENPSKKVFLIMEEMSRANVAAVFGDLFQLLDRDADGRSEYSVNNGILAEKAFGVSPEESNNYPVYLPSNLTIIGTVNTNDQNVFAMDTAFKRRFTWKYVSTEVYPDSFTNNAEIRLDESTDVDWYDFYRSLNDYIVSDLGLTEDKQIGPYFINFQDHNKVNEEGKPILVDEDSATELVRDKLLQYLWEDVASVAINSYSEKTLFSNKIKSFSKLYDEFGKNEVFSHEFVVTYKGTHDGNEGYNHSED